MSWVAIDGGMEKSQTRSHILRVALTVSCIKGIPVRMFNIGGGRIHPGLMEYHLDEIKLAAALSNAHVTGAELGSTEISFSPMGLYGGFHSTSIKTFGSICDLMQLAVPCALFADSEVTFTLRGCTNGEMEPQVDYMSEVLRPVLERFGANFDFELVKRAYFPNKGGEVEVHVTPVDQLNGVNLLKLGRVTSIVGWSHVAGSLPEDLSRKMAESAENCLKRVCSNVKIESYKEDRNVAPDNGSAIVLMARTDTDCVLGADFLGRRNEDVVKTGAKTAEDLIQTIGEGACVDAHGQDQIVLYMALARGPSSVRTGKVTGHTKTAILVIEKLTKVRFRVQPLYPMGHMIHCTGDVA